MRHNDTLSLPILECWAVFRLHCKAQRYRPSTIEDYEFKLLPFLRWAAAQDLARIDGITGHHIRLYLVEKQTAEPGTAREREASGHTLHGIARCLRAFFNFCVAEGWIAESPMKTVKMPRKPKRILDAYTVSEIRKLFKAAKDDRERTILYVLLDTGLRATELLRLTAGDVRLETSSILVRSGKGEKDRIVYFGAKTARHLIRHMHNMEARQLLFTSTHTGEPLKRNGLVQLLRRIGKRAGLHCAAHKFRRTFAISSLRNGMNVYLLARLMGHEDISILKPYLDLLESDAQAGQTLYGVVDNL
jgi:integrase/recombinase XerD